MTTINPENGNVIALVTGANRGLGRRFALDLLARVMEKTEVDGETEEQRSARASRIIGYFQMGKSVDLGIFSR